MKRNIMKEFLVQNVKKEIDYLYQTPSQQDPSNGNHDQITENTEVEIVEVDPEEPVDDIENDEEIMALMDYIEQMDATDIDPERDY